MVQAYGFTPKQSTRMLDAFQRSDEVHEHQDFKDFQVVSYCMLYYRKNLAETLHVKESKTADIKSLGASTIKF